MSKSSSYNLQDIGASREPEQSRSLLAERITGDDGDGSAAAYQSPPLSQASLSRADSNESPQTLRTVNGVWYNFGETNSGEHVFNNRAHTPRGQERGCPEVEEGFSRNDFEIRRNSAGQNAPLLADVDAPSVVVAERLDFIAEETLENARPKSGLM